MNRLIASCLIIFCWVATAFGQELDSENNPILLDTIFLKSGGELTGQVVSELKDESDGRKYVVFRTESGGLLKLDTGRLIKRIRVADELDAEYQRRLRLAFNDPNLLWQVYQWCEEQKSGSVRFKDELRFLLRRIVELDPNDERARRRLGYDLVDDRWVLKDQLFTAHGYVRQGTSWASELQNGLTEGDDWIRRQEGDRKRALARWQKESRKQTANVAELARQLDEFCDELAVPIIMEKVAKEEPNPRLRLLFVEAFGKVPSYEANQALCYFAIEDPAVEVRERALTLLSQPHFDQSVSVRLLSGYLGTNSNALVRCVAFAIGELGTLNAIMPLIDALETKHVIAIVGNEPGRLGMTFGDGGTGMTTGGGPQSRTEMVPNDASRVALKKITGQDFGFDEVAWQNWYLENYTLYDLNVRVDD